MPRKPAGVSFETFIDRQIREAAERGVFDNLPGAGKPLPRGSDAGMDAWVKRKLVDENLSLPLPSGLQLRKDVRARLAAIRLLETESEVRRALSMVNAQIAKANSHHVAGPPSDLGPVDVSAFMDSWLEGRSS